MIIPIIDVRIPFDLYNAVRHNRVAKLHETRNVGAFDVVHLAVRFSVLDTAVINIGHDLPESLA